MRILAMIALLMLPAALRADDDPAAGLADDIKKLLDVFTILDQQAADPVSPDQAFYQGAIPGLLSGSRTSSYVAFVLGFLIFAYAGLSH